MNRPAEPKRDSRDTTVNGVIVAIAVSVMAWFLFTGLNKLVPSLIPQMADGFSDSLIVMTAVIANIVPMQMFNSQGRGMAMRGVGFIIVLGVLVWALYFKLGLFA